MPAGSTEEFVDGVRLLRSAAAAEGTPLLLIHGGGTDDAAISWFHAFAEFGGERPVVAPDLPGFGRTALPPVGGPAALADVVAGMGLGRAVVVGVSMGGDVALNLALRHPESVAALVLVAPGGLVPMLRNPAVQLAAWLAARLPDAVLVPLARLAGRFARQAVRGMVADPSTLPPEVVDEFVRRARRPGLGYARYNQATLGPRGMRNDLSAQVSAITAPTVILHGTADPMVDIDGSRRAAAAMPHARLVEVEGCGHWVQLERPEVFAREVRALLAELA
ncbi:alpha/beta fold hydrolase [Pseudonocardia sp. WMMC193]|uniref:alpha/beta fold hydrolase n=1 Tax=Pseudonocardia sp. WMMC193 TaxID=2911965 RepID=UPI001F1A988D|nr:alpha/beta hydrolase [Pseudonocardia sp. WMMC193]MCF7551852.1 alpha/beta hydrolase [Pseudonocardia sp. WMMC193]